MTAASLLAATGAAAQAPAPAFAAEPLAPALPEGFAASFTVPDRGEGGDYRTVNSGLSEAETTWHVRVALNVAALGCRGDDLPIAYNALLHAEKDALTSADTAAQAGEKGRWGATWQSRHDDEQTKLYNFWAQPPAQAGFCAVARTLLTEAATVAPSAFPAWAAGALPRLEAPFLAAFARWDAYRAELAAWRASRSAPAAVVLAAAAAAPVIAAPPVRANAAFERAAAGLAAMAPAAAQPSVAESNATVLAMVDSPAR